VSLTQRGVARSVVFATPRAVAAADTAVLYMAAGDAPRVKDELLAGGCAAIRR